MAGRARASGHSLGTCRCALVLGLGAIVFCTAESVAMGGQAPESTVAFTPRTKVSSKADLLAGRRASVRRVPQLGV